MNSLEQSIAFNLDGVHIIDHADTSEVSVVDAGCESFKAVTALGGDIVIASFNDDARITGKKTGLKISNGATLLVHFRSITLDAASAGDAVLTKCSI